MASSTQKRTLKLLIDTKSQRVLFAEAGKDVVDFLFSLLALPIGYVVKLLTNEGMVGCVASIYNSVANLDPTYLQSNRSKNDLLNPTITLPTVSNSTLFLTGPNSRTQRDHFISPTFSLFRSYATDSRGALISNYKPAGKAEESAKGAEIGFVKGGVTYAVMDDLSVTPMSTISSITLLNQFHVKDMGSLEERTVVLGMKEGLELLKASLQSKTVLTDVFLGKEADTAT